MVADAVGGGWGPSVFIEPAKTQSLITAEPKNNILSHFYQFSGLIVHKENARAILRRCSVRQILSTAALLQKSAAENVP